MKFVNALNPYAVAMAVRRKLYESGQLNAHKLEIPVISIGNLTMGGTGKTPTAMLLTRYISQQHQKKIAIVMRGYKRESSGYQLVSEGNGPLLEVKQSGDEAYLLAEELLGTIVVVDENRVRGAEEAKKLGAEIILLDDGYQHMSIHRDLNLLVVTVEQPPGAVLPFGVSREDTAAARNADFLLLTSATDEERSNAIARELSVAKGVNIPFARVRSIAKGLGSLDPAVRDLESLSHLQGKRVLAVSSIANPQRFVNLLTQHGAEVELEDLGDHASYDHEWMMRIMNRVERLNMDMIVTTAKDAVKSRQLFFESPGELPVYVLAHGFEFLSGERALLDLIDGLLSPEDPHPTQNPEYHAAEDRSELRAER
jgi:tetraacyldisaccharide 4'-kinase